MNIKSMSLLLAEMKECKPGMAFNGVIGRTHDVSSPAWLEPVTPAGARSTSTAN